MKQRKLLFPWQIAFARFCLFFSLVLFFPLAGQAQSQPASSPSSSTDRPHTVAPGVYRMSGKVVDAHTGAALARCSVNISEVNERGQSRTTISSDSGEFVFEGLPAAKYALSGQRRGYLAQSYEEHDQFSTAIAVGPGLDSEDLIFKMSAEATIGGTVTDEAGEPIRGAQVRLFEDQDTDGIRSTQPRHTVTTDDLGMYELTGLHPGAYFVVVTAHPWYAQHLQRGNGEAASDVQALDLAYPTTYYPGVTEEDAATPIPVKGGDRLEASLTLAAQPALRLHLALPQGEGGRGISLMLSQSVFGQAEALPTQMTFGSDGSAEVDGILPGHYDVTMNRFNAGSGERPGTRHFEADITGGTTELSEDSSVAEITVTGKVLTPGASLPPNAGITLQVPHARRLLHAEIKESGEFSIAAQPGSYEVAGNLSGMYIASLKATGAVLAGRTLTVKAGDSPKLEIVAGTGHGEVEGTVLRGAKPASAVMVLLAPEDPKDNQILFRRDQSDSDGTFDIQNIVPGRYRLLAIENGWDLEWANPSVLAAFLAKSVPVEVKSGGHLKQMVEAQSR